MTSYNKSMATESASNHLTHSGFSTKAEEEVYNRSVFKAMYFVQLRLVKMLKGTDEIEIDEKQYEKVLRNLILKI
jgi:hypothetical protein